VFAVHVACVQYDRDGAQQVTRQVFHARDVVVAVGPEVVRWQHSEHLTSAADHLQQHTTGDPETNQQDASTTLVKPTETYTFGSNVGFPGVFGDLRNFDRIWFGLRDGDLLDKFKIGFHGERNFGAFKEWSRSHVRPEVLGQLESSSPCYYTFTHLKPAERRANSQATQAANGECFSYCREHNSGVVFVNACNGEGFKYAMVHGLEVMKELARQTISCKL
jgi:hypothetical protein